MTKNEFKNLPAEIKCFVYTAGIIAFLFFAMGIDSIVENGIILGTFTCIFIGLICGAAITVLYVVAKAVAPEKTEKFIQELTEEADEKFTQEPDKDLE